ncbi:hypothetical protein [uncultured Lacinutrix sp.]|uniref:carboxypeptidase-like regulatory domain-containing protein n=1 Tax=uncultured Lacinutrix sp. TaxID=574032 RepID=UPI0026366274|nr:hypothetical protein [uncultured Lacinutrix sp.]
MKPFYILLILFCPITLLAQTVNGVIYNATSTIEDIKIENLSNKKITYTNKNGAFTITAKTNDTLKVSAFLYKTQNIIVKPIHEKEALVIQLKETKNTLEEVNINGTEKEKIADVKATETNLKNALLEDIKNNPHLYGKMPEGNLDIIKIIGLVAKLFKNKNKADPFVPVSYENLISLFNNKHSLFNDALLTETLDIEKDKKFLFFEFVEAKNIDSKLLTENKDLDLLENIIKASEEFNTIIKNFKREKTD